MCAINSYHFRHLEMQLKSSRSNCKSFNKVDIVPAPVTNVNRYFTGTGPSFTGLSNTPVVSM